MIDSQFWSVFKQKSLRADKHWDDWSAAVIGHLYAQHD